MSKRVYYIDWLRVLAVLLLFPFHTWRIFNADDPFYVKAAVQSRALGLVLGFIDVWHMPLLFLLAGASTYFAMRKRSGRQYLGERVTRLLVPLGFGILFLIPPQTWYGGRFNSGYSESFMRYIGSGDFMVWNIQNGGDYYGGFGLGHLWFILYLFIISIVALPIVLWWRSERGSRFVSRFAGILAHPAGWLLAAFLLLIGEALPSPIEDKRFFFFMMLFLMGYAVMASDAFEKTAVRYRWPALISGLTLSVWWLLTGTYRDSLPDPSLLLTGVVILGMLTVWLTIVGFVGVGKVLLDKASPALSYLGEASYPLYILHQTVIVVAAFYVVELNAPWPVQWLVLLAVAVGATFALFEVVRRVGVLRFLFGMKPKAAPAPAVVPAVDTPTT